MKSLAKLGFPIVAALGLATPAHAQTVVEQFKGYSPSVSYKPTMVPMAFSLDAEGNLKYELTGTIVTPAGEFTFSGSVPKPKATSALGMASFNESMKRSEEQSRKQADAIVGRSLAKTRAEAEALLRPSRPDDLARKVAALEEENRRLRAKLRIYEPADSSPMPAGIRPLTPSAATPSPSRP